MSRLFRKLITGVALLLFLLVCPANGAAENSILIDTSHDCFWSAEQIEDKFSMLIEYLQSSGHEVAIENDFENLLNYNVAVFLLTEEQYSTDDVALVRHFLNDGGALLVMGEWYQWFIDINPLNALLDDLGAGIQIREASLLDPVNNQNENDFEVIIQDFSDNCLMDGLESVLHSGSAPLTLENPDSALYYSSADSYLLEFPEEAGPFTLAAVADPKTHSNWNLIVTGDTSQLSDYAIVQMDNDQLFQFHCSDRGDDDDSDRGDVFDDNEDDDGFAPLEEGDISGGCGCG